MQELVILKNKEAVTTSLQVAESFEKKHKHVLEAIESIKRSVENSANVEDGSNFGQMFVEGARNRIKAKQFDDVIEFINNWMPSTATMTIIKQTELLEDE